MGVDTTDKPTIRDARAVAVQRLREGEAEPDRTSRSLKEVMGDRDFEEFREMDPEAIPDEDLFE